MNPFRDIRPIRVLRVKNSRLCGSREGHGVVFPKPLNVKTAQEAKSANVLIAFALFAQFAYFALKIPDFPKGVMIMVMKFLPRWEP